jgi:hypothetical protein
VELYRVNRKARRRKGDLRPQALNYLIDGDMRKGSKTYPSKSAVKVHFYSVLADFRKSFALGKVPRQHVGEDEYGTLME